MNLVINIVEMQVVKQLDFGLQAQYYTAQSISYQLNENQQYDTLLPVVFIGVLDFSFIENPHFISHHLILDIATHKSSLRLSEYHFIELPKFNKEITQDSDILEKWVYFLKNAQKFNEVPDVLDTPVIQEAFHVLAKGNWSREELLAYDRYLDQMRSRYDELKTACIEGEEIGKKGGKREMARQLLDILNVETIAKKSGLSIQEIEKLKRNVS
jgi:predicted transposase/invertase (TIGR01784 family)